MEIPSAYKYRPKTERLRNYDFADPRLEVTAGIAREAMEALPKITREDYETTTERARILLGSFEQQGNQVFIKIEGVLDQEDSEDLYIESHEQVGFAREYIDECFDKLKQQHPEYQYLTVIGDLHTHPVFAHEVHADERSSEPSDGDVKSLFSEYAWGHLQTDRPYVMMIAGLLDDGSTEYSTYRIVQEDGHVRAELIPIVSN